MVRLSKGKLQRFLPFASAAEAGYVQVVKGTWTEGFINELEQTEFSNKTFDDQADASSDCFYHLNRELNIPTFSVPDFTTKNAFASPFN